MRRPPVALVTGATAGIGLAFARKLADDHHELVLVARDVTRLESVAESLRVEFGVKVEVLPADLGDRQQVQEVADRLSDTARPVDLLVNNAGFGLDQRFVGGDRSEEERMLAVLCTAVLVLSHAAVSAMLTRGHGAVISVSSMASFVSMGTYSAAKAWVTTFSEGLSNELRGSGVRATALCPGYVHTEFHQRAGIDKRAIPSLLWLDADDVVARCLDDARRGRVISIPGTRYRLGFALAHVLPRSCLRAVSRSLSARRRRGLPQA